MNAIKRHELSHAHVKLVLSDIFKPEIHGIKWSVRMLMLKGDKHLRLDLETLKNITKKTNSDISMISVFKTLSTTVTRQVERKNNKLIQKDNNNNNCNNNKY